MATTKINTSINDGQQTEEPPIETTAAEERVAEIYVLVRFDCGFCGTVVDMYNLPDIGDTIKCSECGTKHLVSDIDNSCANRKRPKKNLDIKKSIKKILIKNFEDAGNNTKLANGDLIKSLYNLFYRLDVKRKQ